MRLYVTPASPWVRRVRVAILELGIEDRFEFVQTRWSHKWATQAVEHRSEFLEATPVVRIPALVTADAAPDALDKTCVKLRVVRGTDVMVLLSTSVPVEDAAVWLTVHRQGTGVSAAPASNLASTTELSDTSTTMDAICAGLKPSTENLTS